MTAPALALLMRRRRGLIFAGLSAVLSDPRRFWAKLAIAAGLPPLAVVAARTAAATVLLLIVLLPRRGSLAIFPLGLVGCLMAGAAQRGRLAVLLRRSGARRRRRRPDAVRPVSGLGGAAALPRRTAPVTAIAGGAGPLPAGGLPDHQRPLAAGRSDRGGASCCWPGFCSVCTSRSTSASSMRSRRPTVAFYTLAAMTLVVSPVYLLSSGMPQAVGPAGSAGDRRADGHHLRLAHWRCSPGSSSSAASNRPSWAWRKCWWRWRWRTWCWASRLTTAPSSSAGCFWSRRCWLRALTGRPIAGCTVADGSTGSALPFRPQPASTPDRPSLAGGPDRKRRASPRN